MEKSMAERGLDAAQAFMERTGMTFLERDIKIVTTKVPLVFLDGNDLVLADVKVRRAAGKAPEDSLSKRRITMLRTAGAQYIKDHRMSSDVQVRIDSLVLLVIGEDRALLRHARAVSSSSGSEETEEA